MASPTVADIHAEGLDASKPAASSRNNGFYYKSTDVNGGTLYRSNGSAWVQQAGSVTPTDATGSVKGAVLLANDLGGTAALPTVPEVRAARASSRAGTFATLLLRLEAIEAAMASAGVFIVPAAGPSLDFSQPTNSMYIPNR